MSQARSDLAQTQSAERGWVMLIGGDRITAVHGHDAFIRSIREERHDIWPKITRRRALYVLAEPDGVIRAACAFTISFDARGHVCRDLELPLRELSLRSGDGPDLGWGRIQLACASQCSRPELADQLWGSLWWDVLPILVEAQRLLRERFRPRGKAHRERRSDAPGRRAIDHAAAVTVASANADRSFGPTGVLSAEQLRRGRRLASVRAREATEAKADTLTSAEVDALRAEDRKRIEELERELADLRARLENTVAQ